MKKQVLIHFRSTSSRTELPSRLITNRFSITTGALFTEAERDSEVEFAFKYAVDRINADHFLLPNTTLVTDIQYVSASDSFHASKKGTKSFCSFFAL